MKPLLIAASLGLLAFAAQAVELEVSPQDAYARAQQEAAPVLFVDVRDPVEIMFVGFTDAVDTNVPYLLVDRNAWNEERGAFQTNRNPDFIAQIQAELDKRGLGPDTEIITMCRSGSERGKPSADFLRENGFPNARYVVHGFQGSAIGEGPQAGFRLQNGWQNSGLPWSPKMNPEKIYRTDHR
ncbi:rhodanese-like domain-containing protein [Pseudomonas sp.]|uniref:rhodanese-like domain-containing protein n=1 Tax=Pseudomonas sp. TaxID=306 RepID=UPI003D0BA6DC